MPIGGWKNVEEGVGWSSQRFERPKEMLCEAWGKPKVFSYNYKNIIERCFMRDDIA